MHIAHDEARRTHSFARIALALVALGGTLALTAPACSSSSSGGGSGDSCNEDDVCDEEEDCDCVDCAGTSFCDSGAGGSSSASTTGTTSSTTAASTSAATTAASTSAATTSATSSTSSGGGFTCGDVSDTANCPASDPVACACLGCELAACDDGMGGYNDCVCANCAADPYCSDAANCQDDGVCDPGYEGCVCADCAGHPLCP
jgi:hypothetical protein